MVVLLVASGGVRVVGRGNLSGGDGGDGGDDGRRRRRCRRRVG